MASPVRRPRPARRSTSGFRLRAPQACTARLLVLALLCTTLTFVLSLRALRRLSAFTTNLTVNLEPVYGIFLAYFLLDDARELGPNFYWGAGLIVFAVFGYGLIAGRLRRPYPSVSTRGRAQQNKP